MARTYHHTDRRDPLARSPRRPVNGRRTSTRSAVIAAAIREG